MSTERKSKACRLCACVERKLVKLRAGIYKKVDSFRYGFANYEHPDSSYNDDGVGSGFPVPTPPVRNNFDCNALGPFPVPAPPSGWRGPQNLDLYEASGSNHTSNQNSEIFDADALNCDEYRRQHEIANYGDLHRRRQQDPLACPSLGDQLAASFQDVQLETPTSHDHRQPGFDPWNFINDPDVRDQHQTENNCSTFQFGSMMNQHQTVNYSTSTPFHYGPLMDQHYQAENNSTSTPFECGSMMNQYLTDNNSGFQYGSMMDQQQQTENNYTNSTSTFQHGSSMITGDTGECMMDTGASYHCNKYILDPVAEETLPIRQKFHDIYWETKGMVLGEPRGGSGRRGRGFRIMARILYITIRLKAGRRIFRRRMRKRPFHAPGQNIWRSQQLTTPKRIRTDDGSSTSSVVGNLLQGQNNRSRQQCNSTKTRRQCGGSLASGSGAGQTSTRYLRITPRNGKWCSEIRLSKAGKFKVWLGTFETEVHAALASDAGVHHCSVKKKPKNKFNFTDYAKDLGPSQYQAVHKLYVDGRHDEAKAQVADLARIHANTYAPFILGAAYR